MMTPLKGPTMVWIAEKGGIKQASEEARKAKQSEDVGNEVHVFWISPSPAPMPVLWST